MVKRLLPLLCLAMACDTGFPEETVVDGLRVLGIRSTPADLKPGETARLQSLILDPALVGQRTTTLWVGCAPDPFNLNRSACSNPAVLQDPASLAGQDGGLPEGVKIIGFNEQATYSTSADLFAALPPGDPRRLTGTVGQVLAIAVAQEVSPIAPPEELQALFARVQAKQVDSIIALFRIRISEDPQRNVNPVFGALTVDGAALPTGATLALSPGEKRTLDVSVADETFEAYEATTPNGVQQKTERLLAAWYSTSGRYSEKRTALREDVHTVFTAPGPRKDDPVPEKRTGTVYVTLRDTRGGQSWQTYPMFICDTSLPEAMPVKVTFGERLVVEGQHLESLLDVVVNDLAVKGAYDAAADRWEGPAPALASGRWPVTFSSRRCTHPEPLSFTVP